MENAKRPKRWRLAASAGMIVLAINVAGCSKISGMMPGAASDSTTSDAVAEVAPTSTAVTARVAPGGSAPAARPALNQPVAARVGSITQTLALIGKVSATEEVPLSFAEKLTVKTINVKPGQAVEAGQVLITTDGSGIQSALDAARARLQSDTAGLAQAQAAAEAQQKAAARQAAAAAQAQADRIASAQANLNTARVNLQKVQAGAAPADVQAAQNAVASAQLAARKAQAEQDKVDSGPDADQIHAAEQGLANAQAAVAQAQADLVKLGGQMPDDSTPQSTSEPAAPTAFAADNVSPPGVSTDADHPANNFGFQAIAADPNHSGTVYVGTSYQGLWKTTDGGHTWAKVNTGSNGKELDSGRLWLVVLDPTNSQIVYTAPGYGNGGLWKSTDGGVNWTALFGPKSTVAEQLGTVPTPTNLAIDPANHLHMIASSHFPWGGKYKGANGVGVLETTDGGNTWTIHDPISNSGAEHEVALIDSSTWLESYAGGTYRTTDAGATWSKVTDSSGETQNLINVNGVLYLPAPSGALRSTDNGASWKASGPGGMAIVNDGSYLYVQQSGPGGGHQDPIYYSPANDGVNWTQYSQQTMCTGSTCDGPGWVAYDAGAHSIYFSNWTAGVWKLQTVGGTPVSEAPTSATSKVAASTSQADVIAARQRYQAAKDAAEAARAKLETLRGGPDQNTVDSAQLSRDQAQAALQAAQARLAELRRGPNATDVKNAQDAVNQAQAALDRARAGADESQDDNPSTDSTANGVDRTQQAIDADNAEIAKQQDRLTASQLVAPFDGTVVSIRVKAGDTVDDSHAALTIAKPGAPIVKATVTAADFDKVSVGQQVVLSIPGTPETGAQISATVKSMTANDAGTARTLNLDVDWPDTPPKLGTVMNVGLVMQQKEDALLVPKKAVHNTGSRTFVELIDGSNRRMVNVQVGIVGTTDTEIVSGLSAGQLVVIGP